MFDEFLIFFNEKTKIPNNGNGLDLFLTFLGGKTFRNGLFNSFSKNQIEKWKEIVSEAFPSFSNKFNLFGYDWLGRCFGIDLRNNTRGNILMFEIGTNDVLEIPCSFDNFLNKEIPIYSDACLAESFFYEWINFSKLPVKRGRCIGYKIPLFLGGMDTIENLEDSDMEVYWSLLTQIKKKV